MDIRIIIKRAQTRPGLTATIRILDHAAVHFRRLALPDLPFAQAHAAALSFALRRTHLGHGPVRYQLALGDLNG